jgi:hypothetical protein
MAAEEPSGADEWVSREGQLGGEWLPPLGWYRGTVENDAEGTTELTLAIAEDA